MRKIVEKIKDFNWGTKLTKYKAFEIENRLRFNEDSPLLRVVTSITDKGDHAGAKVSIELLKYWDFGVSFYDVRHWNWDENRWYEPYEEAVERFENHVVDLYEANSLYYDDLWYDYAALSFEASDLIEHHTGILFEDAEVLAIWHEFSKYYVNEYQHVSYPDRLSNGPLIDPLAENVADRFFKYLGNKYYIPPQHD